MRKPKLSHQTTIKRILRYIRGTSDYDILFLATYKGKMCKLVEYTDYSWCGDTDDTITRTIEPQQYIMKYDKLLNNKRYLFFTRV